MLGTTIVATALTTGDTMSHTIRAAAVRTLGQTDELVSAKGTEVSLGTNLGSATGVEYFDEDVVADIDAALAGTALVDGITPAVIEEVAVQAPAQRQNEPRVTLFAADPDRMEAFGAIDGSSGEVTLDGLSPGQAYLNEEAASELGVSTGDHVLVFAGGRPPLRVTVKDVVNYEGAGTNGSAVLMPLEQAQAFLAGPVRSRAPHPPLQQRGRVVGRQAERRSREDARAGARPARPRHRRVEAGRDRGRGPPGQLLHGRLHDVRLLLDRRRDPPHLPRLRHARHGAARGSSASPARSAPGAATSSRRSPSRAPRTT